MMKTNNMGGLTIDVRCLGESAMLCGVKPCYQYTENSQRTDTIAGYKYTALFSKRPYQYIDVKIPGKKILDVDGDWICVRFEKLNIKTYCDDSGQARLTAKAEGLKRITTEP